MRALTRDSGKEVSVLNGDFECGNDGLKSQHVWRLCDWTWQQNKTSVGPEQPDLISSESPTRKLAVETSDSTVNYDEETTELCFEILLLAAAGFYFSLWHKPAGAQGCNHFKPQHWT